MAAQHLQQAITELHARGLQYPNPPEFNAAWREHLPTLMQNAQHAAQNGHNYRDPSLRIGCGVLGYSHGKFDTASVGWNNTPRKLTDEEKAEFKPCSEKHGVLDCLNKLLLPVGLVMYTDYNQRDDVTGLLLDVYVACSNCEEWMSVLLPRWFRMMFFRKRLPTDPRSDDPFVRVEMTLYHLGVLHREAWKDKLKHL